MTVGFCKSSHRYQHECITVIFQWDRCNWSIWYLIIIILVIGDSEIEGVGGRHSTTPKITTDPRSPSDTSEVEIQGPDTALIKAHGNYTHVQ